MSTNPSLGERGGPEPRPPHDDAYPDAYPARHPETDAETVGLVGDTVDHAARQTLGDLDLVAAEVERLEHPGTGVDGLPATDQPSEDADQPSEDEAKANASLGRHTTLMASGTAVSRVLGFVRNIALIAAIGATSSVANAFDIANKLPNMLFAILAGGMLNAVLVPQIVRAYQSRHGEEHVNKLLTLAGIILLALTTVLTLASSVVVAISTTGWTDDETRLAVAFAFWCIPQLFFYGVYTLLGQVLNARGQFGPFMWSPALNNIVAIAGTVVFIAQYGRFTPDGPTADPAAWDGGQIALLAGTATLGIAAQALILLVPLYRGGFRYRVRLGFRGIGLRSAGNVAGWTFLSVLLEQAGILLITRIASSAQSAADVAPGTAVAGNAAYSNALLIYLLPHSLVTVSIATALFTGIAGSASRGDLAGVRTLLSRGLRTVGVFTIFAAAVMVVLAEPLVRVFIPTAHGGDSVAIAHVLAAMAFGLVGLGGMVLMKWVYFAFEDGRTVFWIQVPATVLLVGLSWLGSQVLPPTQWVVGIGASMAIANTLTFLLRSVGVSRTLHGMDARRVAAQHTRVLLATAVASAAGVAALAVVPDDATGWVASMVVLAVVGSLMALVYAVLLRLLRVPELTELLAPFTRRLGRFAHR
ncbi:murein biosynthesis integral membrane protein MurJ [Luteimicrobium subarcticum]|uniref:Putative peptidoglycan lipid II flippase n=1 Tax=Luteimicrobium subarcticum TaxID=620910 RepID=A0A2M8WJH9_9MICO|nr:murein biosynthesis integral membrane protein MurJ [Luteimicrobium subarcticum]PJI91084.1 putative peptidoglycan lipid II flippase [Luteimicrobium subarcticum]